MADAEPEMVITKEMEAEEAKLQKEAAAEPVDLPTVIPPPHTTTLASAHIMPSTVPTLPSRCLAG